MTENIRLNIEFTTADKAFVRAICACRVVIRRVLGLFLTVFLLAFPYQAFNAVSDTLPAVNTLPRFALVIGNSHYRETPLKNPGNDANAMAEHLRRMGFTVTLKLDANRQEMIETIRSFGSDLLKQKGVGVFYFAGHGAQLSWRNYLIPVDASLAKIVDIDKQAVDMSTLLDSLTRARNPMNVIILDACRDNPFGDDVRFDQKGLSQMDAPPGTLLAYATSPGNVAADGVGTNGLYTEYLLKEMQTPQSKIEDVFKRVRLHVRRQSRGQQIPWESTSLEDDFYLLPPKQIVRLTEDELEKQFEEELGSWERIRKSKDLATLEDYLRRFPSGKFSELAQFRFDRLLAQQEVPAQITSPAPAAARPSSLAQITARPDPAIAEAERKRQEELVRAEAELKKQQELAKADAERKRQEEIARAETERKRQEALAKAEAERKRLDELARVEAEQRKKEDLARAEADRRRQDELARAEAELKKQQELAKSEADRRRQETLARVEPVTTKRTAPAQVAAIGPNPFSRGTARLDLNYKAGDIYSYRVVDTLTKIERKQIGGRITEVTDDEVIYGGGRRVTDLLGNDIRLPNGAQFSGQQFYVAEYSVGKKWTTRYRVTTPGGAQLDTHIDFKVSAREQITVPAGTFNAFKVEGRGYNVRGANLHYTYWIAPEQVRRAIVFVIDTHNKGGKVMVSDRHEMIAYRQDQTIRGDPGDMSDATCDDCQAAPKAESEMREAGKGMSEPEREKGGFRKGRKR